MTVYTCATLTLYDLCDSISVLSYNIIKRLKGGVKMPVKEISDIKNPKEYGMSIFSIDTYMQSYYEFLFFDKTKLYLGLDSQRNAQALLRVIIEKFLCMTPQQAYDHFTDELINKFRLNKIIKACLSDEPKTPKALKKEKLFQKIYPEYFGIKDKSLKYVSLKSEFERVNRTGTKWSSTVLNDKSTSTALELFGIVLEQRFALTNPRDLYKKFADGAKINNIFAECKVYSILKKNYDYPIDLLHKYFVQQDIIHAQQSGNKDFKLCADPVLYQIYKLNCITDNLKLVG